MRLIKTAGLIGLGLSRLVAGDIHFEIRDFTIPMDSRVIVSGTKKQTPRDIREIKIPGISQITHFIPLVDGFALKISTPEENNFDGFGLSAWSNSGLFSWEWFDREQGTTFKKLQEGGSLKVETTLQKGFMIIKSIEVLTDVSLRLEESGSDKISYRVLLKKGTVISLIS